MTKNRFKEDFVIDLLRLVNIGLLLAVFTSIYELIIFVSYNKLIEYEMYYNILFLLKSILKNNLWLIRDTVFKCFFKRYCYNSFYPYYLFICTCFTA